MTDHYFTDSPAATAAERRRVEVTLGGREVSVETAGGTFSPTGLDKATAIFLDEVPEPPSTCLLYTSPSPRDVEESRMPSSA